ncbi:cyclic nucleotide-binding domain-containing protein [Alteromonas sp. a30]|uniref:cyclic nucleotide-binding domain-containing protein n=1 Tax=Alteromonas sp. a30 TaxID=2730917 RepID=UPI0022818EFE|nr:cyclic nucleotide-binding domain-containing protein [Alteromonas sp. a30]MCY7296959.1 cyclic nucleotide-binding domain-containing protein [Alteromonas sp. a30]
MNKIKLMEILPRIPLFKDLTVAEREMVLKLTQNIKRIRADKTFIKEGAQEPFFYIILAGRADVFHKGRKIGELLPGNFIGEVGFICKEPRSATVTSATDMVVMLIADEQFRRMPARIRESIKDRIISGLVERVTGMNDNTLRYEDEIGELKNKVKGYEQQDLMNNGLGASVFEHIDFESDSDSDTDTDLNPEADSAENVEKTSASNSHQKHRDTRKNR